MVGTLSGHFTDRSGLPTRPHMYPLPVPKLIICAVPSSVVEVGLNIPGSSRTRVGMWSIWGAM